jgi:signal transduction histidine kinase
MSSAPNKRTSGAGTREWRSIGARLALWYVAVMLASFLALAAIVPLTVHAWVDREGQRSTETRLDQYRGVLEAGGTDALRAMFDCHDNTQPSVAIELSDQRNIEIYSAASDAESTRVASNLKDSSTSRLNADEAPKGWHVAGASVSQGRQLQILLRDDSADRLWKHARQASLLILGCGLVFAVLGAFVITRRALRPIGELARATEQIVDSGDLSLRVRSRGSDDDLDRLTDLFNQMLTRNETLVRVMKESLDNVAHDLRTPLTRLRTGAELALRDEASSSRARDALAGAIEESDRVLSMLTTLMDIAEAETGSMRLDKKPEDLAAIARESIDLYDLVSSERGVHIVTRLSPNVMVLVDRARIRQVCANLIDNAIKYTAPGGNIEVKVSADEGKGVLSIIDTGMGIPPGDLPRIWDRLYRGDRSRTERGLGLGLALVKAVVEAHGGQVEVKSEVGAGSTFEVRFQIATTDS